MCGLSWLVQNREWCVIAHLTWCVSTKANGHVACVISHLEQFTVSAVPCFVTCMRICGNLLSHIQISDLPKQSLSLCCCSIFNHTANAHGLILLTSHFSLYSLGRVCFWLYMSGNIITFNSECSCMWHALIRLLLDFFKPSALHIM